MPLKFVIAPCKAGKDGGATNPAKASNWETGIGKKLSSSIDYFSLCQNCKLPRRRGGKMEVNTRALLCFLLLLCSGVRHRCQMLEESNQEQKDAKTGSGDARTSCQDVDQSGGAGICMCTFTYVRACQLEAPLVCNAHGSCKGPYQEAAKDIGVEVGSSTQEPIASWTY